MKRALIIVDVQNDFLPGGTFAVPQGDEVLPLVKQLVHMPFDIKVATQDWHPPGHCSFASTWSKRVGEHILVDKVDQILWPDHCVQDTVGAELSKELDLASFDKIVHKGTDSRVDSYSTFFDNQSGKSTGLENYLHQHKITDLYIAGLTTEYCVFYSSLDALDLGFRPHVIIDACRGINVDDVEQACQKMKEKGVKFVTTHEIH